MPSRMPIKLGFRDVVAHPQIYITRSDGQLDYEDVLIFGTQSLFFIAASVLAQDGEEEAPVGRLECFFECTMTICEA